MWVRERDCDLYIYSEREGEMKILARIFEEHQGQSYHILKQSWKEWEIENETTHDGSLDFRGRPARKSLTGGWRASAILIWFEMIERLTYYGILSNLITYLTTELREGTVESAMNVTIWGGVTAAFPILGAFLSDSYLGRYCAIAVLSTVYILGLIFLTVSVTLKPFKPAKCDDGSSTCPEVTRIQIASFFISLYLISIGMGGVKPCLQAFASDQFDDTDPVERKGRNSLFNWRSFGCSTGCLLAFTVLVYIQDNGGWGTSFLTLTVSVGISLILFLAGTPLYRRNRPGKSPLNSIAQVLVAALCKWNVKVPDDSALLYENYDKYSLMGGIRKLPHTKQLRFLDKAATMSSGNHSELVKNEELNAFLMVDGETDRFDASVISPWKLCTVTQVEELKLILRTIPIWITSLSYGVVVVQVTTLFTKQGNMMDRQISSNFSIPAASLGALSIVFILILLPIYDQVLIPIARKITGNERGLTVLQRIAIGLYLTIIMMIAAALTESNRLKVAKENGLIDKPNVPIPMSIFWLLPQYLIFSVVEVTAMIGMQEFWSDQVPDRMRSIGMALNASILGVGNLLSSLLITVVHSVTGEYGVQSWFVDNLNRGRLDCFYFLLAVLCALNFCIFILVAHSYTYKKFK